MNPSAISNTADHSLRLPDGRQLGYAIYGAPDGMPVLYFHGAPGSRRSIFADMAAVAAQRGVCLIAPERPGYGISDPLCERSMGDWIADVVALTNALGIARFKLIGFSMGSPYALACAHALPMQVERVAIIGGLAPMNVAGVTAGRDETLSALYELARSGQRGLREALAPLANSPSNLRSTMAASAAKIDQALLTARAAEFEDDFAEALRHGVEGVASDLGLVTGEWSFSIAEIQAEVDLWCGTGDRNTPPAMSRYLASVLPHSQLLELPGEGHFCLYTHWHDILDRLI